MPAGDTVEDEPHSNGLYQGTFHLVQHIRAVLFLDAVVVGC